MNIDERAEKLQKVLKAHDDLKWKKKKTAPKLWHNFQYFCPFFTEEKILMSPHVTGSLFPMN